MSNLDGKYRITIAVDYEIKSTGTEFIAKLPVREIKKRTRQVKSFIKCLKRLKRKGWQIGTVEVGLENGTSNRTT